MNETTTAAYLDRIDATPPAAADWTRFATCIDCTRSPSHSRT
jgi:hypothetical protein